MDSRIFFLLLAFKIPNFNQNLNIDDWLSHIQKDFFSVHTHNNKKSHKDVKWCWWLWPHLFFLFLFLPVLFFTIKIVQNKNKKRVEEEKGRHQPTNQTNDLASHFVWFRILLIFFFCFFPSLSCYFVEKIKERKKNIKLFLDGRWSNRFSG